MQKVRSDLELNCWVEEGGINQKQKKKNEGRREQYSGGAVEVHGEAKGDAKMKDLGQVGEEKVA